ncbi:hypothetical protein BJY04DRAFT_194018 [Aspergillus karnatakaensis]|uniref:uncharacterized protein n=1 Tax=Aspergillus karnatakaensis TaxID=1810916 RepID=UPI003CCD6D71
MRMNRRQTDRVESCFLATFTPSSFCLSLFSVVVDIYIFLRSMSHTTTTRGLQLL